MLEEVEFQVIDQEVTGKFTAENEQLKVRMLDLNVMYYLVDALLKFQEIPDGNLAATSFIAASNSVIELALNIVYQICRRFLLTHWKRKLMKQRKSMRKQAN